MEYRTGPHTKYKIEYHFAWITKYRYQVLTGDIALRLRELARQTCAMFEIEILRGVVSKDHVHTIGFSATDDKSGGDYASSKGPNLGEVVSGVSPYKEAVLGKAFWG